MNSFAPCKPSCSKYYFHSPFDSNNSKVHNRSSFLLFHGPKTTNNHFVRVKGFSVRAFNNVNEDGDEDENTSSPRRGFLSLEEAGLVEMSGLNTHERFLCRLTISSLNLLRVIADQEGCTIEELNAGKICDWFLKDKLKREQNIGSSVLQWEDDDPFQF